MTDYTTIPVFLLRSWLSSEFINSGIIDQDDYADIDPIIPVQDIEKTNEQLKNLPYLVYSSIPSPVEQSRFFLKEEIFKISIYSNNYNQLSSINAFLIDMLDREDSSALDINDFTGSEPIAFKHIKLIKSDEPRPAGQPAGRFIQTLLFEYQYTRSLNANNRFS